MRTLAETDVDAEERDIIEAAVESGIYTKNTDVSAKLFPLKTKDGLLISVGTLMDIPASRYIESSLGKHRESMGFCAKNGRYRTMKQWSRMSNT